MSNNRSRSAKSQSRSSTKSPRSRSHNPSSSTHSSRSDITNSRKRANDREWEEWLTQAQQGFEYRWRNAKGEDSNNKLTQMQLIRTLGQGSFGRVVLVIYKPTNDYYAMKIMEKEKIAKMKQVDHILNEKQLLYSIQFPFIVGMAGHFKDNSYVYLVLEFVNGGEMFTHLRKVGRYSEFQAKFYGGQVTLAFEYLHSLDIAYRDLKPENILIDFRGYLKIVDFGFAKRFKGRTYSICGTPEYMAPEIIKHKGYNKSVDWWCLGILIYEMVVGRAPFEHKDHVVLYEKIVEGKFKYADFMSSEVKNLVGHLITGDLTRRYGNLKRGVRDIKDHKWFESIDWMALFRQQIQPPYVPQIRGTGDASNFKAQPEQPLHVSKHNNYAKEFEDF